MKNFHESRKTGSDGHGVPGVSARVWLPAALAAGVLTLFYAMCMLDIRSTQETPQVIHVQLPTRPVEPTQNMLRAVEISTTLVVIAERASTVTASVGMINSRIGRIMAAGNAASNIARFAQVAEELAPGSAVAGTLQELAVALSTYDIDRVRSTSLRLAELRQQLSGALSAAQQTDYAPAAATLKLE